MKNALLKTGLILSLVFALSSTVIGAVNPDGTYFFDSIVGMEDEDDVSYLTRMLEGSEFVIEDGKGTYTDKYTSFEGLLKLKEEGIVCPADETQTADCYTGTEDGETSECYITDSSLYTQVVDVSEGNNYIKGYALYKKSGAAAEKEPTGNADDDQAVPDRAEQARKEKPIDDAIIKHEEEIREQDNINDQDDRIGAAEKDDRIAEHEKEIREQDRQEEEQQENGLFEHHIGDVIFYTLHDLWKYIVPKDTNPSHYWLDLEAMIHDIWGDIGVLQVSDGYVGSDGTSFSRSVSYGDVEGNNNANVNYDVKDYYFIVGSNVRKEDGERQYGSSVIIYNEERPADGWLVIKGDTFGLSQEMAALLLYVMEQNEYNPRSNIAGELGLPANYVCSY